MQIVKLMSVKASNFKGKSFDIKSDGRDVLISGLNKSGKTRVLSSILWCLTGKDFERRSDYEIISHDGKFEPATVEIVFDGGITPELKLTRVYEAKPDKISGEIKGYETSYFINGASAKKKGYDAFVAEKIAPTWEDIFSLMKPYDFFEIFTTQEKLRTFILQFGGTITDSEVIARDERFNVLTKDLATNSIEKNADICKEQIKKKNAELDAKNTEISITENMDFSLKYPDLDTDGYEKKIAALKRQKSVLEAKLNAKNPEDELAGKIESVKAQLTAKREAWQSKNEMETGKIQFAIKQKAIDRDKAIENAKTNYEAQKRLKTDYDEKKIEFDQICKEINDFEETRICSYCKSKITDEDFFNETLSMLLKKHVVIENKLIAIRKEFTEKKEKYAELKQKVATLTEEHDKLTSLPPDANPEYAKKPQEIQDMEKELSDLQFKLLDMKENDTSNIGSAKNDIEIADAALDDLTEQFVLYKKMRDFKENIDALQSEKKTIISELEASMERLKLCSDFKNMRITMLEKSINDKFDGEITWKMFEKNLSDDTVRDVCYALDKNGCAPAAWSSGQRITLGLLIIEKLQELYNIKLPILIDNSELANAFGDYMGQKFFTCVSTGDFNIEVL